MKNLASMENFERTNLKESRNQREAKDKLLAEYRENLEDGISHAALGCKPNLTILKQFKADSRHLTVGKMDFF